MVSNEFKRLRSRLDRTQKEMAQLLGVSVKAIHSYEQGWRKIPGYVERQVYFLLSRTLQRTGKRKKCWDLLKCPEEQKIRCPAYEFQSGDLCWFVNGTQCGGNIYDSWEKKMEVCRRCDVFLEMFDDMQGC
ncbi:transcriptional regulator [Desulfobacter hydrogenophilus]|uniref:Transcriptional regulator n=1 Tax=Desulfobacter hydrogenophilus TaxID=2291 RepID=A0A328FHB1_9BACT|nr:helix-turn-helix domain-containing protein [Desulfobacter hydrogenophilus]NDY71630.1 transcriptional regulator [Desulfobacter hydrogenophilus]QBH15407.1 transcriptional regulator [Desulfobacter hydrogenophilus]RAM02483.1 transcriptional regulator [Desulfobacter hydrogenophilus]